MDELRLRLDIIGRLMVYELKDGFHDVYVNVLMRHVVQMADHSQPLVAMLPAAPSVPNDE